MATRRSPTASSPAGVRYGAGYPITPWSSHHGNAARASCRNTAASSCRRRTNSRRSPWRSAARYAGHLAVTGSAGPGISLKMEAIGWASHGGDPAHRHQRAARRPVHRPADQRRAERSDTRPSSAATATARASCSRRERGGLLLHRDRGGAASRGNTPRPVIILSDSGARHAHRGLRRAGSRRTLMVDPSPTSHPSPNASFKPYPLDRITQHAPPGTRMRERQISRRHRPGARRNGPPHRQPASCTLGMTAKRRNKLQQLAAELPLPEIYGDAGRRRAARRLGLAPTARSSEAVKRPRTRRRSRCACTCATCTRCRTASTKSSAASSTSSSSR